MSSNAELGPLVKNCDLGNGWSAEHFGPNACDNVKEVSASSFSDPNRKLNPSPRGGRIQTRVQPVTRTNKGKSDSKILEQISVMLGLLLKKRKSVVGARNRQWKMHLFKRQRLMFSPADTNDFLSLELPGAWEPPDSSRACGYHAS